MHPTCLHAYARVEKLWHPCEVFVDAYSVGLGKPAATVLVPNLSV
jgi:hypothetical protein